MINALILWPAFVAAALMVLLVADNPIGRRSGQGKQPPRGLPPSSSLVRPPADRAAQERLRQLEQYEQTEREAERRRKLFADRQAEAARNVVNAGPYETADEYLAAIGWDDHATPGWERGSRA